MDYVLRKYERSLNIRFYFRWIVFALMCWLLVGHGMFFINGLLKGQIEAFSLIVAAIAFMMVVVIQVPSKVKISTRDLHSAKWGEFAEVYLLKLDVENKRRDSESENLEIEIKSKLKELKQSLQNEQGEL